MTVFMTKVFGFDEPVGPLQFGDRGWRESARSALREGDLVVLVGTFGPLTATADKGRLLGMMDPTKTPVLSLDFEMPYLTNKHYNDDRTYKWPYGLHIKRAWSFPEKPRFSLLVPRVFHMNSARGIVPLTDQEAQRVLSEPIRPAQLITVSHRHSARENGGRSSMNSPVPTTTRQGIMHKRSANAVTYILKVLKSKPSNRLPPQPITLGYKIGWAFDHVPRAKLFNRHAMAGLGGLWYEHMYVEHCATARQAFGLEQRLLRHFQSNRHSDNHEIVTNVSEEEISTVFRRYAVSSRS